MNQLMQLHDLKKTIQQLSSQENIRIEAKVPFIDYAWVKQSIKGFLEEQKLLNSLEYISIYFTEQPIKKNIIRCDVNVKISNKKLLTVTGQGIDEY